MKSAVKDLNSVNKNLQKELNFSSKKIGKLREDNDYMSQQIVYGSQTLTSSEAKDFIDKRYSMVLETNEKDPQKVWIEKKGFEDERGKVMRCRLKSSNSKFN